MYWWGEVAEAAAEKGEGRRELYRYKETSAMPVVLIDVERGKKHKTGYMSLYTKLFKGVVLYISKMRC